MVCVAAAALLASACCAAGGFVNPGTPLGVPPSYDCAARKHAYEFGKKTLPVRGEFRELYDAMQLQACGVPVPAQEPEQWSPPKLPTPSEKTHKLVFADASAASGGNGSLARPFNTLAAAVAAARGSVQPVAVLLRKGRYAASGLQIDAGLSNVTIQNYNGEEAVVGGGLVLSAPAAGWEEHRVEQQAWVPHDGVNNIFGQIDKPEVSTDFVKYVGTFDTQQACFDAVAADSRKFLSATWHTAAITGFAKHCYGKVTDYWAPVVQEGVASARLVGYNTWKINLKKYNSFDIGSVDGLRVNGLRAVRAKYPDGSPELSGQNYFSTDPAYGTGTYLNAWVSSDTKWTGPTDADLAQRQADTTELVTTNASWPGVYWPDTPIPGFDPNLPGMGDWGKFMLGKGGFCAKMTPDVGYYCTQNNPRGITAHYAPIGFDYSANLPQAANWSKPEGAIVNVWRGNGRWYTNLCRVNSRHAENTSLMFDQDVGCDQGGEGAPVGSEWWVENVKEECDAPGEYYYDEDEGMLYYAFNTTETPGTAQLDLVATDAKVMFNVTGATPAAPVQNFALKGLVLRDSRQTYIGTDKADLHGLPTGGDWALQQSGAVTMRNTANVTLEQNLFTRLDGNGVFAGGYHRGLVIRGNEFRWIGGSAMAAWGETSECFDAACTVRAGAPVGPDARGGEQPRGTLVEGNLAREVGVWQKQSSMWFQAATSGTVLRGNVFFNGPRACINLNDGMGGGDVIERNFVGNCVRESGDHGPINTWSRLTYITDTGLLPDPSAPATGGPFPGHKAAAGKPSVLPMFRTIAKNFFLGTYSSMSAIDNDDGSTHYLTHHNYFVYGSMGLKGDFNGGWNHHYNNVYGYTGQCFLFVFNSGMYDAFYNNVCQSISKGADAYPSTCGNWNGFVARNNSVHTASGSSGIDFCNGDTGSTESGYLSDADLTAAATAVLM